MLRLLRISSLFAALSFTFGAAAAPTRAASAASPMVEQSATSDAQLRAALAADRQLQVLRQHPVLPLRARAALSTMMGRATYAVMPSFIAAFFMSYETPSASPAGSNVPCTLTSAHPYPVVLVHGTVEDQADTFGAISPILANNGYCVYSFNYGGAPGSIFQGVNSVPSSAATIATAIRSILAQTHAAKVDLVGHSQGGLQLAYVAKEQKLAPVIHDIVALDPPTHGTTFDGLVSLGDAIPGANGIIGSACQACLDQEVGSAVLKPFDVAPIAQPGPTYTVIETRTDEVITPPSNAFINEKGVTDEYIQNACPFDFAEHINTPYDLVTIQLILNALDPAAAKTPNCFLAYPFPA